MMNFILGTKLVRSSISRLIARTIRKKYGYDLDLVVNGLDVLETKNERVIIKLNADINIDRDDLERIIDKVNIERA